MTVLRRSIWPLLSLGALLSGCTEAGTRPNSPMTLNGTIERIAPCTMQKLTDAGFGPPGLIYLPYTGQPKASIIYRAVPNIAPGVGLRQLQIDFLQFGPDRVRATLTPTAIGGSRVLDAAVPALQACQGG